MLHRCCLLTCLCLVPLLAPAQSYTDRIYGRVVTQEGDTFEGLIRWDKNEASWVDLLNGSKTTRSGDRRRRTIEIFGIEVVEYEEGGSSGSRISGVRFGHLERLENTGSNRALLTLRSGQRVEFRGGSTDIGNDVREIIVEDPARGEVELRWRNIDAIDFRPTRDAATSRYGPRLFGTLTTRNGYAFTGYICWDVDEVLAQDILDGEDENGYDRKIPFGTIARIERESRRSSRVLLRSGDVMVLRGSNDVNDENRGILVLDPYLGQVQVDWDTFEAVTFSEPDFPITYNDFFGSGLLKGTVVTRDGQTYTGVIRWDDDEAYAWELLNGELDGLEFDIEFAFVREIERLSSRAARVFLRDGRSFDLRDSNDVNDENDGIFVTLADGSEVKIDWDDFERVRFDKP